MSGNDFLRHGRVIHSDIGGDVDKYLGELQRRQASGELVTIAPHAKIFSAGTLAFSLKNLRVASNAEFFFHMPRYEGTHIPNPSYTQAYLSSLPEALKAAIAHGGGLPMYGHLKFTGAQLRGMGIGLPSNQSGHYAAGSQQAQAQNVRPGFAQTYQGYPQTGNWFGNLLHINAQAQLPQGQNSRRGYARQHFDQSYQYNHLVQNKLSHGASLPIVMRLRFEKII